jgi:hypothetical protein
VAEASPESFRFGAARGGNYCRRLVFELTIG